MARKLKAHGPRPRTNRNPRWYAKEWLEHKRMAQARIVEKTTYSKGMVSDYLSGDRRWNEDVLFAFAAAIGVPAAHLLRPPLEVENDIIAIAQSLTGDKHAYALRMLKALGEDN